MYQYPKQILTIEQQVQSYVDAGMKITSQKDVEKTLKSIGFYRLRGYSFQLYDNAAKKYVPGTKFEDIIKLYQFDQELSALVFSMISKIEVALRVRLVEALLIYEEPLVLQDSSIFKEKKRYWQNMATVASEISRFMDIGGSVLRNMCAHNSRIYNRTIHTTPEILDVDKITPPPAHNGLYQILLAMKYLRSSDEAWTVFVNAFDKLIQNNSDVVSLAAMNLPADWKEHLSV